MQSGHMDSRFAGSIPELYERELVPLIFDAYAADLAQRCCARHPRAVLEIAAGTGAVTRALDACLAPMTELIATDLNPGMLAQARESAQAAGSRRSIGWQEADAMALPFEPARFDAIVCQFGVMFFPDRAAAFAQMHRVLRPGGTLLFNVWERLAENEFPGAVSAALADYYPDDPPRFLERTPYGYCDREQIASDLARGGFAEAPRFHAVSARSRGRSAQAVARAFCQGTPLRAEIEQRDPTGLEAATACAAAALEQAFGDGRIEGRLKALIVEVAR